MPPMKCSANDRRQVIALSPIVSFGTFLPLNKFNFYLSLLEFRQHQAEQEYVVEQHWP
jgi:hypothetical protein